MKRKITDIFFTAVCAVIIFGMGIGTLAWSDGGFSQEENRALAGAPRLTLRTLASGEYFTGLSAFYADNIPLRKLLIRVKALGELSLGKRQNNGVVFLSDGTLVDRCEYDGYSLLNGNLQALKAFAQSHGAFCALVPRSADVLLDGSEIGSYVTQTVYGTGLCPDTLQKALLAEQNAGRAVYYKTDHHLNAHGAYVLYSYIAESLGVTPYAECEFDVQTVSEDFLGSVYSRSGLIVTGCDSITLYRYEGDGDYTVSCEDKGCEQHALYDTDRLLVKDKYGVFLGGNHGVIQVLSADDKPNLLLVKDSFANAVIPLLARHFDLTVIDPRYVSEPVCTLAEPSDFSEVVILMGIDTLATTNMRVKFVGEPS